MKLKTSLIILFIALQVTMSMMAHKRSSVDDDPEVDADSLAWVQCYERFPFLIRTAEDVERDSLAAINSEEQMDTIGLADVVYVGEGEIDSTLNIDGTYVEIEEEPSNFVFNVLVWENGYGKVDKITYYDENGVEHGWLPGEPVTLLPQSLMLDYRVTKQGNLLARRKPFADENNIFYSSETPMLLYIATHRMWFPMQDDE